MEMLITGGAGFLGRGILRFVRQRQLNWRITVYSRDETKQDLCRHRYPEARYVLGDVRDEERLALAMAGHDTVIHGAAMKYIPEAEVNAAECLSVNVGGAQSVIRAARRAGVKVVVGISTDKAVQPVNTYGCSKMAMERLFAEASDAHIRFVCVRYGNVVGSTGSVIPFFERQLVEQGVLTITDPKMTRFWMSIGEAIELVRTAATTGLPGSVIIPQAKAMTMTKVAEAVLGEPPNENSVQVIGIRPGEKLHERLLHYEESVRVIQHEGHLELRPPGQNVEGASAITITSQNPHYWMKPDELRELVADAKEV